MGKIKWIDYAKGFAMLCVVFGHSIVGNIRENNIILGTLYNYIYLFHMPLFFFLSGFLYQKNENKYLESKTTNFVCKKAKSLMLPYFTYSILTYLGVAIAIKLPKIGAILIQSGYSVSNIWSSIKEIAIWQNSLDQHLWFIYALFIIFVINFIFIKNIDNKKGIFYLIVLLIVHIIFLKAESQLLQRVFNYLVYFYLGRYFYYGDFLDKIIKNKQLIVYISAVILSIGKMAILDILFESYILTALKALYSVVTSLSMVIAICLLFKNNVFGRLSKFFERIYKYNFEIYLLHQPFIVSGMVIILTQIVNVNQFLAVVLVTLLGIEISIIIAKILNKWSITRTFLFGKSTK